VGEGRWVDSLPCPIFQNLFSLTHPCAQFELLPVYYPPPPLNLTLFLFLSRSHTRMKKLVERKERDNGPTGNEPEISFAEVKSLVRRILPAGRRQR